MYTINTATGAATQINTIAALTGGAFGVDFNPVPDALRIVSDAGQNLRITLGGGGVVNTDGLLNPGAPSIAGAAYSNNFAGATQTTLWEIDYVTDQLFTQGSVNGTPVSPNTGTLFTVGPLGVNTGPLVGFDISGLTGTAYASLSPTPGSALYAINLSTGAATLIGNIGAGNLSVRGISVQPVPEPGTAALVALGILGTFRAANRRRR